MSGDSYLINMKMSLVEFKKSFNLVVKFDLSNKQVIYKFKLNTTLLGQILNKPC